MVQFKNQLLSLITFLLCCFLVGCSTSIKKVKQASTNSLATTRKLPPVQVAVVLGSGGSRGLIHLGVLEALEEAGIPVDLIVGSSAGGLVGALYADNPDAKALREKVINLKRKDLLDPSLSHLLLAPLRVTGPIQGNALRNFLSKELSVQNFDELKIPLVVVATDIDKNEAIILNNGSIIPAVHASAAVPPLFAPVCLEERRLVDGGVIAPVPVEIAKRYNPKMIIAINISTPPEDMPVANGFDVLYRSVHIGYYELAQIQTAKADFYLHPHLSGYGMFEDKYNVQLYEKGKATAQAALQDLKKALARRNIKLRKRGQGYPAVLVRPKWLL